MTERILDKKIYKFANINTDALVDKGYCFNDDASVIEEGLFGFGNNKTGVALDSVAKKEIYKIQQNFLKDLISNTVDHSTITDKAFVDFLNQYVTMDGPADSAQDETSPTSEPAQDETSPTSEPAQDETSPTSEPGETAKKEPSATKTAVSPETKQKVNNIYGLATEKIKQILIEKVKTEWGSGVNTYKRNIGNRFGYYKTVFKNLNSILALGDQNLSDIENRLNAIAKELNNSLIDSTSKADADNGFTKAGAGRIKKVYKESTEEDTLESIPRTELTYLLNLVKMIGLRWTQRIAAVFKDKPTELDRYLTAIKTSISALKETKTRNEILNEAIDTYGQKNLKFNSKLLTETYRIQKITKKQVLNSLLNTKNLKIWQEYFSEYSNEQLLLGELFGFGKKKTGDEIVEKYKSELKALYIKLAKDHPEFKNTKLGVNLNVVSAGGKDKKGIFARMFDAVVAPIWNKIKEKFMSLMRWAYEKTKLKQLDAAYKQKMDVFLSENKIFKDFAGFLKSATKSHPVIWGIIPGLALLAAPLVALSAGFTAVPWFATFLAGIAIRTLMKMAVGEPPAKSLAIEGMKAGAIALTTYGAKHMWDTFIAPAIPGIKSSLLPQGTPKPPAPATGDTVAPVATGDTVAPVAAGDTVAPVAAGDLGDTPYANLGEPAEYPYPMPPEGIASNVASNAVAMVNSPIKLTPAFYQEFRRLTNDVFNPNSMKDVMKAAAWSQGDKNWANVADKMILSLNTTQGEALVKAAKTLHNTNTLLNTGTIDTIEKARDLMKNSIASGAIKSTAELTPDQIQDFVKKASAAALGTAPKAIPVIAPGIKTESVRLMEKRYPHLKLKNIYNII